MLKHTLTLTLKGPLRPLLRGQLLPRHGLVGGLCGWIYVSVNVEARR